MRGSLLLLLSLLLPAGCRDGADDGGASALLARGDAELAAGRIDAAREQYERAKEVGGSQAWRVRAETKLVQLRGVETAAQDARFAIDAIAEELATAPSAAAREEWERILAGASSDAALRAHAETRLAEAERRRADARIAENAVVEELIAGGQFAAATLVLRELEARRAADDVAETNALLERIATASTEAAERCIRELPGDDTAAVAVLEEKLAAFSGTPGAARILAAREARLGIGFSRTRSTVKDSKESDRRR
jgi:hypothetical protein